MHKIPEVPPKEGLEKVSTLGKVLESTVAVPIVGFFSIVVAANVGLLSVEEVPVVVADEAAPPVLVSEKLPVELEPPSVIVGIDGLAGVVVPVATVDESGAGVAVVDAGLVSSAVVTDFGNNELVREVAVVPRVGNELEPGKLRLKPLALGFRVVFPSKLLVLSAGAALVVVVVAVGPDAPMPVPRPVPKVPREGLVSVVLKKLPAPNDNGAAVVEVVAAGVPSVSPGVLVGVGFEVKAD